MEKMSMETFCQRYGENSAVAALAVIVEDEEIGKKRLTHDATHGVRVNHRIRCRDKLRAPGAREKKQLLLEMMERGEVAFSVVGETYRNPTGDSNIARKNMASWAARWMKLAILSTLTKWAPLESTVLATGARKVTAGPPPLRGYRSPGEDGHCPQLPLPLGYGLPLQMGQDERGLQSGYGDGVFQLLGLTHKRASWLVHWLQFTANEMAQGLGRLGFAAISLDWERPFLGPLYACSSAIQ